MQREYNDLSVDNDLEEIGHSNLENTIQEFA
jgi:hypothetical protein